jgi:tetratricopeptide (TPR) repeat protein
MEGHRWLDALLAQPSEDASSRGKALLGAGILSFVREMGPEQARCWTEQSLAIARATGDRRLAGWALHNLGMIQLTSGNNSSVRAILEESVAVCREAGDALGVGMGLRDLGHFARIAGDTDRAAVLYRESLAVVRAVGHRSNIAWTLVGIADLSRLQKDPDRARAGYEESLTLFRQDGSNRQALGVMLDLSELERSLGNFDEAEAYLKDGLAEHKQRGWIQDSGHYLYRLATLLLQTGSYERGARLAAAVSPTAIAPSIYLNLAEDLADHEAAIRAARAALGDEVFAAAWAEGQAMTLDEAITYALEEDGR